MIKKNSVNFAQVHLSINSRTPALQINPTISPNTPRCNITIESSCRNCALKWHWKYADRNLIPKHNFENVIQRNSRPPTSLLYIPSNAFLNVRPPFRELEKKNSCARFSNGSKTLMCSSTFFEYERQPRLFCFSSASDMCFWHIWRVKWPFSSRRAACCSSRFRAACILICDEGVAHSLFYINTSRCVANGEIGGQRNYRDRKETVKEIFIFVVWIVYSELFRNL